MIVGKEEQKKLRESGGGKMGGQKAGKQEGGGQRS